MYPVGFKAVLELDSGRHHDAIGRSRSLILIIIGHILSCSVNLADEFAEYTSSFG